MVKFKTIAEFEINGIICPKARPRFNGSQAYLPEKYRIWKEKTIIELLQQARTKSIKTPIDQPIYLIVRYFGHANSDADNVSGSIMDALTDAKIIVDDNLNHIPMLTFIFYKTIMKNAKAIITLNTYINE